MFSVIILRKICQLFVLIITFFLDKCMREHYGDNALKTLLFNASVLVISQFTLRRITMNIFWLIPLLFDALRRLGQDTLSDITLTHQQNDLPKRDLYLREALSQHATKKLSDIQQFWVEFFATSHSINAVRVTHLLEQLTVSYMKWQLKSGNPMSFELFRRQQGLMELYAICIELFTGSSEAIFFSISSVAISE